MKILKLFFAIIAISLLFSGCLYNFIVPEDVPVIDPDDPNAPQISFATEIVPIFANSCTACHDGGQNPDLRAENAFSSINSTRYLNKATPEESKIYAWVNPDTDSHTQKKYTATEAAIILGWIQQGAKNN